MSMGFGSSSGWRPFVSVGTRMLMARRQVWELRKRGYAANPVVVQGQDLRGTFWGDNWRTNLESSAELAALLPSALEYLRNDLLVDLKIEAGQISALVQGAELYTVKIEVPVMPESDWQEIVQACERQVGSVVELLAAAPASVVTALTRKPGGLYPSVSELKLSCSCAEWAGNCKHVTAALCGAGVRLDAHPDLLFRLRQVDPSDLVMHPQQPDEAPRAEEPPVLAEAAHSLEEPFPSQQAAPTEEEPQASPLLARAVEQPLPLPQSAPAVEEQVSAPLPAQAGGESLPPLQPAQETEDLASSAQPVIEATAVAPAIEETVEPVPTPQAAEVPAAAELPFPSEPLTAAPELAVRPVSPEPAFEVEQRSTSIATAEPARELPAAVMTATAPVPAAEIEPAEAIPVAIETAPRPAAVAAKPAPRPASRATRKAKQAKPVPRTPLPRVRGWRSQTTTMELLLDAGLSTSELREWLADGTLILTDQATVYYTTPRAEMLLERKAPKPTRRQAR